jgi:putative protease
MYRKYADNPITPTEDDMKKLTQIFNRGGELGSGYYFSHSGKNMLSTSPKSTGIYIGRVTAVKGKSCTIKLCESLACGDGIEIWTKGEHTGTNISKQAKAGESITLNINGRVQKGDLVYKSYDKGLIDSLKNGYNDYTRRAHVRAELFVQIGSPLVLTLTNSDGVTITAEGAVPEKPQKNSMTYSDLTAQLSKTGNTPFILDFD